jgi:glycerol-3-phosphate dehydrogenase (NAD(P)+)
MQKIAVIGTTSWGITLCLLMVKKGQEVRLLTRTQKEAASIKNSGLDKARFPGVSLPPELIITSDVAVAMNDASAVILPVPSPTMRQNVSQIASRLTKSMLIISAAKGLEIGSNKRMSQVIAEEINPRYHGNICVVSGPNLAREIQRGLPAAAVAAAENIDAARRAQKLLTCPNFCIFTNTDIIGVELGGSLKNIIALGAGIADGLEYGDNAKAAFMTRGLTEITALGMALGANPLTFSGLAGLGDVIATCASPLSRNHYVGSELARGRKLEDIVDSMTPEVAEGVNTTLAAKDIAQHLGLEMPITEKIYRVLYENADCRKAAEELMGGHTRHELSGRRWRLFSLFRRGKKTPPLARS